MVTIDGLTCGEALRRAEDRLDRLVEECRSARTVTPALEVAMAECLEVALAVGFRGEDAPTVAA